jgi:flagellar motility protein MotE (MotC chaperone)
MSEAQDADSSGTEDLNESIRECSERLKTEREYLNKSRERKRKRQIKELDDELQATRLKNQKLEQEFKEKQEKLADLRKELRENVKQKEENNKKLGTLLNQKKEAELANERESLDVFGNYQLII